MISTGMELAEYGIRANITLSHLYGNCICSFTMVYIFVCLTTTSCLIVTSTINQIRIYSVFIYYFVLYLCILTKYIHEFEQMFTLVLRMTTSADNPGATMKPPKEGSGASKGSCRTTCKRRNIGVK